MRCEGVGRGNSSGGVRGRGLNKGGWGAVSRSPRSAVPVAFIEESS